MLARYPNSEKILWLLLFALALFFGRSFQAGLAPDAALYAGLSLKIFQSHAWWQLEGLPHFFPRFFEHPPYFFQWGALVLNALGVSDGAARSIGALPGVSAFLFCCFWARKRFGWAFTFVLAFMLASFGHYTKYASTVMLEAPLSLGVILCALASFEYFETQKKSWLAWALVGLALATASKGVAGLGAWGAFVLLCVLRGDIKKVLTLRFLSLALFSLAVALLPLGLWAFMSWNSDPAQWDFLSYFKQQVLRSALTNRESPGHEVHGDLFYYLKVILKNGWPWWFTVPALWIAQYKRIKIFEDVVMSRYSIHALIFFLAYFLPFSLTRFQLPHYLHPTYLVLAPLGAFFVLRLVIRFAGARWPLRLVDVTWFRWGVLVLVVFVVTGVKSSATNRGAEFRSTASEVNSKAKECVYLASREEVDSYRMGAYALWYWQGRQWRWQNEAEALSAQKWDCGPGGD